MFFGGNGNGFGDFVVCVGACFNLLRRGQAGGCFGGFGEEDWDSADCCGGYDCEYRDDAAGNSGVYDGGF